MNIFSPNETWTSREELNGKKKKWKEKMEQQKEMLNRRLLHFPSKQYEFN